MNDFDLHTVRIALHLLAVSVWVGGQIVLAGLVPVMRDIGGDAPKRAAARFGRLAWPFFGLAVATGIWNIAELEGSQTNEYLLTLVAKLAAVTVSGVAAFVHQRTPSVALRGVSGGLGLLSALAALVLGVML